ncbi:MAG: Carnitinyl-CoA dehydratase [Myxococcota bacterium]|nr:Carnitinyl-CoA dehydratase [Myxococcota bacterium]
MEETPVQNPPLYETLKLSPRGEILEVRLNRPDVHNAFNQTLVRELREAFEQIGKSESVRVVIVTGEGKSFCAGADLKWMSDMANFTVEQNHEDAAALAAMFNAVYNCPKPVIGRINGAAVGGGVGLTSVCDVAVAAEGAAFGLSEVRIGLVPAVIFPYLLRKVQISPLVELTLTSERISAARAREIGLVNHVVPEAELDAQVTKIASMMLNAGPCALANAKELIRLVPGMPLPQANEYTARVIAEQRVSPEGQEGMRAFLEKRSPSWAGKKP